MMHFDEWWNSAAADSFRAKHEDLDGEVFRTVWDAAQLAAVPQPPACNQSMQPELATYSAQARNKKKGIEQ